MSTTQIGAALDTPADISPTERLVLVLLARYAGPGGVAFPGISRLSGAANVSTATVTRALRRLRALGLIERAAACDASGATRAAAYRLTGGHQANDGTREGSA